MICKATYVICSPLPFVLYSVHIYILRIYCNTCYVLDYAYIKDNVTLTEGMAKISDAADVNALACRRSDVRPATTPPVYVCVQYVFTGITEKRTYISYL